MPAPSTARVVAEVVRAHFGGTATVTLLEAVAEPRGGPRASWPEAVGVADTIPYVRDTLRGATRPHRGTWLIWGVLAVVVCLSQYADGASWSLVMAAVQAVLTCGIFVLVHPLGRRRG